MPTSSPDGGPRRREFRVWADHYQFYVEDAASAADTGSIWDDRTLPARLAVDAGLIAIGTARYGGQLDVAIELRREEPPYDLDAWDHVAVASVTFPSGELALSSPSAPNDPDNPTLTVPPGTYRLLARSRGLDAIPPEDIDDEPDDGPDRYEVLLWPGPPLGLAVLKQWPPALTRFAQSG